MFGGVSDMEHRDGTMVLLAIFLSRFEAVEIASMLRGYGILVSLDGEYFTATTYQSLTFGGYRLRVLAEDHAAASDVLRACDAPGRDLFRTKPRGVLLWFLAFLIGWPFVWGIFMYSNPAIAAGTIGQDESGIMKTMVPGAVPVGSEKMSFNTENKGQLHCRLLDTFGVEALESVIDPFPEHVSIPNKRLL